MAGREQQKHILVIGAGVIGLTTALFLAEAGYKVTVVAAHIPGDESVEYTSPWAGAHWRTAATPAEPMVCDWDVQTYAYWSALLEEEAANPRLPRSGLQMQSSHHFWDKSPTEDLWWSPYVNGFKQLSTFDYPVVRINQTAQGERKVIWAVEYQAPSINVPVYLRYLVSRAQALGVNVARIRLPTDGGLERACAAAETAARRGGVDCFVNASGLGARDVCGDTAMYPIRGQTVLVNGEAAATRTRTGDGYIAYCIPRPGSGTTILGGTKEDGVWSGEPDEATTGVILERARLLAPELLTGEDGGFEVVSVQCGLRPGRKGGPRVEREIVGKRMRTVVHAYGHSGGGYQNSVGSARMAVELVRESVGRPSTGNANL